MDLDTNAPPPPPQVAIQNFSGFISDDFVSACQNQIPFYWPVYNDAIAGDTVCLYANGTLIFLGPLPQSAADQQKIVFYVSGDKFQYTGRCNLHFTVLKTSTNPNISDSRVYTVQRDGKPSPDDPKDSVLPAPVITPTTYDQSNYDRNIPALVTISYPKMQSTDIVTLKFELQRTTSNYAGRVPTFYNVQDIPVDVPGGASSVTTSLPASTFANVDENIASVYYTVRNKPVDQDSPYLQAESRRNLGFIVDVVPPYSA